MTRTICPRPTRRIGVALLGSVLAATLVAGHAGRAAGDARSTPSAPPPIAHPAAITAPSPDASFSPEQRRALEEAVARRLAAQGIPGAVAGVWYPGRGTWVHAAGVADLATGVPIAPADAFRIASITKPFTATVILQLVDEGRLALDDRLETYISGIPGGERVTIRHLLGMSDGLFNFTDDPAFSAAYTRDPLMPFTPDDLLAILRRHEPEVAPGESVRYSDTAFYLLGMIVERLTGQPVGAAITERIIRPLGLTGTSYATTPEMPDPHSRGYATDLDGAGTRDVTRSNPAVAGGAGAMISTLADLRTAARAFAGGSLLSPAMQQQRLAWRPFEGASAIRYGLGLMEISGFIGHGGDILGYSSWMLYLPDADATIVVLTNRDDLGKDGATRTTSMGILFDIIATLFPERLGS